jgi:heme-degrading monooxygenase HmoA
MVTVLSRFTVANGMEAEVREAFVNRPHLVAGAPGFVRPDASGTRVTVLNHIAS